MPYINNDKNFDSDSFKNFGEFRSLSPTVKDDKKHKKQTDKDDINTQKAYEPLQGFSVYPSTDQVSKNTPMP